MLATNDTSKTRRWLLLPTGVAAGLTDGQLSLITVQCRAFAVLKSLMHQRVQPRFPQLEGVPSPAVAPEPLGDEALSEALAGATADVYGVLCLDVDGADDGLKLVCRRLDKEGELQSFERESSWDGLFEDVGSLLGDALEVELKDLEKDPNHTGLWLLYYLASLFSAEVREVAVGTAGLSMPQASDFAHLLPESFKTRELSDALLDGLTDEPLASRPEWAQLFAEIAAAIAPESPEPDRVLGELAAFSQASENAAEAAFLAAIGKADEESKPEIQLGWAKCLEFLENFEKAGEIFSELLDGPQRLEALYGSSRVAERTGDTEKYLEHCETAASEFADKATAHFELATALRNLGHYDRARVEYRRALDIDPDLSESMAGLGSQLIQLGRIDLAETVFRDLLEIQGENPTSYLGLGEVGLALGNAPLAEECFRRVLDLSQLPGFRLPAASNLARMAEEFGAVDEAQALWAEVRRAAAQLQKAQEESSKQESPPEADGAADAEAADA